MAVGLVLLFHAGVPLVSGGFIGVDVFFVLSGFLITGLIIREVERTGRLNLSRFYARRIRRLLPAAALTTVGVAVLTVAFLPVTRWYSITQDIFASTLYYVNWRLAGQSVDYMNAEGPASPLQHFWSLAIEEQFYVVWPLLIAVLLVASRVRSRHRMWFGIILGAVAVGSLAWSLSYTSTDPGRAYFVTTTRAWELAAGGLLAVAALRLGATPVWVRRVAGWLGLVVIGVGAVTINSATPYPGTAAIVPVAGSLLVIFSGLGDRRGEVRLLSLPVMQDVGALSYSLYLWHWPLLVVAAAKWANDDGVLPMSLGLVVVAASAVPAWLSYRAVERPIHTSTRLGRSVRGSMVVGVVAIVVGLLGALYVQGSTPPVRQLKAGENPGAAALVRAGGGWMDPTTTRLDRVFPGPAEAFGSFDWTCETTTVDSAVVDECELFTENTGARVAAVGDSHLQHWLPAIRKVAEENNWRLTVYIKQGCPLIERAIPREEVPYATCEVWNATVQDLLAAQTFDLMLVGSIDRTRAYDQQGALQVADAGVSVLVEGYTAAWNRAAPEIGAIVAIRGTPVPGSDVPECLAQARKDVTECDLSEEVDPEAAGLAFATAVEDVPEAKLLDMNDVVCPSTPCPAVIGGVLVYRDGTHLSAAYVETLAPLFEERLAELVGDLDSPQSN